VYLRLEDLDCLAAAFSPEVRSCIDLELD
jgi:hypothetical protein